MAKHLTIKDIRVIISLIDGWDTKLGWEQVCDAAAELVGTRPTRQTLNAHADIKAAFDNKKELLRSGFVPSKKPASLQVAAQRISRLETELARVQKENHLLLERFVRWQYNAYKFGVTAKKLDEALPVVDRDSSEKKNG